MLTLDDMNAIDEATARDLELGEPDTSPIIIGARGTSFQLGDLRVDLSRRKPVARILWALTQSSLDGQGLATPELIAAGWPGEKLVRNAGRIRLRVAIATLRSMGLSRIVTTRTGYRLGGRIVIEGPTTVAPPSHERAIDEVAPDAADIADVVEGEPEQAAG